MKLFLVTMTARRAHLTFRTSEVINDALAVECDSIYSGEIQKTQDELLSRNQRQGHTVDNIKYGIKEVN